MTANTKRALRSAALAGLGALFGTAMGFPAETANAASITYQLNTVINGNTLTPSSSYGTGTYTDNGNSVDVTIDLADHSNGASKLMMKALIGLGGGGIPFPTKPQTGAPSRALQRR